MQQTTTASAPIPTEFSPEFTTWLDNEKNAAKRHRSQVLKMAFAIVLIGCAMFLLKGQPEWVQQIVEAATQVKP